jgi:hypothetical protein
MFLNILFLFATLTKHLPISSNIIQYQLQPQKGVIVVLASGLEPPQIQSKPVGMSVLKPSQKWFEER